MLQNDAHACFPDAAFNALLPIGVSERVVDSGQVELSETMRGWGGPRLRPYKIAGLGNVFCLVGIRTDEIVFMERRTKTMFYPLC